MNTASSTDVATTFIAVHHSHTCPAPNQVIEHEGKPEASATLGAVCLCQVRSGCNVARVGALRETSVLLLRPH